MSRTKGYKERKKMKKKLMSIGMSVIVFAALLGMMAPVQAQIGYRVSGQVFNTDGSTVDEVDVTVTDINTSDSISTTTAGGGWYQTVFGPPTTNPVTIGDTLELVATYGTLTNTTIVTATGSPQTVNLILREPITPPTVEFIPPTPANDSTNTTGYVNFTVNVTESDGRIDIVNISIWNETGIYLNNETMYAFDEHKYFCNVFSPDGGPLPDGDYTYKAYAKDIAGNTGVTETRVLTVNVTEYIVAGRVFDADGMIPVDGVDVTVTELNTSVSLSDTTQWSGFYKVSFDQSVIYIGDQLQLFATYDGGNKTNTTIVEATGRPQIVNLIFEVEHTVSVALESGYNMISLPLNDSSVTNASSLLSKIGANCTEALKWDKDTQAWKSYYTGDPPIFDFDIGAGDGCFVIITNTTTVGFTGKGWESPFTISLVTDYNMIGIPVNDTSVTNASSLLNKIGANCTEVLKWDKGTQAWKSYYTGDPPIFDFDIGVAEGCFVVMTGPADVTFVGDPWRE